MGACKFLAAPEICSGRPGQSRRFPRAENRTIHPKFSFFQKLFSNYFLSENRTIHPKFSFPEQRTGQSTQNFPEIVFKLFPFHN